MTATIALPTLAPPMDGLWHVLLDLGEHLTIPWSLVGGQMVLLHALEHGREPLRPTRDGDVIADIRSDQAALKTVVALLQSWGFVPDISSEGIAHRYARPAKPSPVVIDVLAPDHVGERANLETSPPGRTIEVPAGTQALRRTEMVVVRHGDREGRVPRPTLLAAIVGKAAAATKLDQREKHYGDLALLLSLLDDPFEVAEQVSSKDRKRLRGAGALLKNEHPAWALVPDDIRPNGPIALEVLIG